MLDLSVGQQATRERARSLEQAQTNIFLVVQHIQPCTSHAVLACSSSPTSSVFSIKRSSAARLFGTPPPHVSSLRDLSNTQAVTPKQTSPLAFFHPRAVALGRTARTPRRRLRIDGYAAHTDCCYTLSVCRREKSVSCVCVYGKQPHFPSGF
jgi:hypothetical protein